MTRACRHPRQDGLALVCALMLMLGTLILGVSIARTAFGSMASSRLERERVLARAAAGAALADAQADIEGGAQPSSARAGWLAAGSGGFVAGCGHGVHDLGLCLPPAAPLLAPWQSIDLADLDDAPMVPYGRYTGAALAVGGGILPARLPAYLIERLEPAGAGPPSGTLYRITAIGFGTRTASPVVLQAIYRKPAAAAPPGEAAEGGEPAERGESGQPAEPAAPARTGEGGVGGETAGATPPSGAAPYAATPPPAGRIGWREIANWPELHARAVQSN